MEKRGRERSIQREMAGPCQALRSRVYTEACELNPRSSKRARRFQMLEQHGHTAALQRTLAPVQTGKEACRGLLDRAGIRISTAWAQTGAWAQIQGVGSGAGLGLREKGV